MEELLPSKILYIEDDPEMIDLITLILNRPGVSVKGAQSGREGLDAIAGDRPEVLLLDLMMPDMDGWEVYQQLKADPHTENIPVIIITAKAQNIDKVLGLHIAGVDDYICKPFHPHELIESIVRVTGKKSA